MHTIQCPRCRHTFLSYAAECPECGLKRPRDTRSKWATWAGILTSVLTLFAAIVLVKKVNEENDAPTQWGNRSQGTASKRSAGVIASGR